MPDPILERAQSEIVAVLRKYDLGAIVVLGSKTHTQYVNEFSPSWSCAKLEGHVLRVKALQGEFPSKEAQRECVANTVGLFSGLWEGLRVSMSNMEQILSLLGTKLDYTHVNRLEGGESTTIE